MRAGGNFAWAALALLFCGAGCSVGPKYQRPSAPTPPAYSDNGHNGDWKHAQPQDAANRGSWWRIYGDDQLDQLEQRCATSNQSLLAAAEAYQQAHDLVLIAKSSLYPSISISPSLSRSKFSQTNPLLPPNIPLTFWNFLIPVNISWEPDFWGSIHRQIQASQAGAQASAADMANLRLSLQGLLATTYLQLRGVDLQTQLLRKMVDANEDTLRLTRERYRVGLDNRSDVELAVAQLQQVRAELVDLGVQRAQEEHAIAVLVGVPASGFHLAEDPLAGEPPSIPTGIPSELLERRPDIAATERNVASVNALIGVAESAYYPNVMLGAGGGVQSDRITELMHKGSTTWDGAVTANEVIFEGGLRRAQVAEALAQRAQAVALYREQVLSAFRDVEDQLGTLRVLAQETEQQQQAVDAATVGTQLADERFRHGLGNYLEVLTDQTIELQDEQVAAALLTRRMLATAQLSISLGGGWNASQLPAN